MEIEQKIKSIENLGLYLVNLKRQLSDIDEKEHTQLYINDGLGHSRKLLNISDNARKSVLSIISNDLRGRISMIESLIELSIDLNNDLYEDGLIINIDKLIEDELRSKTK